MLVYIATPYRAETKHQFEEQLKYTKYLAREQVQHGNDVIVPHLYYPQFLNDDDEVERNLGMLSAKNVIRKCDLVLVGLKHGISSGVRAEMIFAEQHNIPLREVF